MTFPRTHLFARSCSFELHFSAQISVQFIFLTCHYDDRRGTGVGTASASATRVRSSPKLELKLNAYVNQCAYYNVSLVYVS